MTEEKERSLQWSSVFLQRYSANRDVFLDRNEPADETWLHHYDQETKAQSSEWEKTRTYTLSAKKAMVHKGYGKEMFIFLIGCNGMIL